MAGNEASEHKLTVSDLWEVPCNPQRVRMLDFSCLLKFKSVSELNQLIKSKLPTISGKYDLIAGIPRSGLLAANLIALHLNMPLFTLEDLKDISPKKLRTSRGRSTIESWKPGSPLRILVVDDSSNSGEALQRARQFVSDQPSLNIAQVHYLAIYATLESAKGTDFFFQILEQPRVFEWNYLHHQHAKNFLFDLDGVLCEDGPPESSDSASKYLDHLDNARPKFIPSLKIGGIVTSRLEKYRSQTESWLKRHQVSYDHLIMINLPNAEERRRLSLHGKFKADVYGKLGGSLFVESEAWQAKEIASITGKAVYNLEDSEFIPAIDPRESKN